MTTNDTLMEQCRREAEEKYGIQYNALRNRWRVVGDPDTVDWMLDKHNAEVKCETLRAVHAAALYAERSKPRLTVDEVMEVVRGHYFRDQHPAESADTYLDEMYDDLRDRLTAKLNQTNG